MKKHERKPRPQEQKEVKEKSPLLYIALAGSLAISAAHELGCLDQQTSTQEARKPNKKEIKTAKKALQKAIHALDESERTWTENEEDDENTPTTTYDLRNAGITTDLLNSFPYKDGEGHTAFFDEVVSDRMKADKDFADRYQELLADLVIETEDNFIHAYIDGDEESDITLTLNMPTDDGASWGEKAKITCDTPDKSYVALNQVGFDGFDQQTMQDALREAIQTVLVNKAAADVAE